MQSMQKALALFLRLLEITGHITREEALENQREVQKSEDKAELVAELIQKLQIKPEIAAPLWQISRTAPCLKREANATECRKMVQIAELNENLRQEIFFAEELVRRKIVLLEEANLALAQLQQQTGDLSLGQTLLRKHLITPEQFVQIKQHVQEKQEKSGHAPTTRVSKNSKSGVLQLLPLDMPQTIGHYEIIREIGRGGMGVVYEARDTTLARIVALKTLIAGEMADNKDIERFLQEAKVTASFQHPNIVPIHEVGMHENIHYFTMDYIDGIGLYEYVKTTHSPLRKTIKMMISICEGIAYAHSLGVIHRDIKPGNILVDTSGKPLIMDFGLAKKQDLGPGLTMSGVALGTPAYMSPEQAEGRLHDIDIRTDIYALGAVLYELLAQRPPFVGTSLADTLQAVIHQEPVPLRELVPGLPLAVDTICMKCLAKNPKNRYPNAKLLIRDLDRFLKGDTIRAQRTGFVEKCIKSYQKNKILYTASAIVFFLLSLFLITKISDSSTISNIEALVEMKTKENAAFQKKMETAAKETEILYKKSLEKDKEIEKIKSESQRHLAYVFFYKGIVLLNKREYDGALSGLSKALEIDPNFHEAYLKRCLLYYKKGLYHKALEDVSKALDLKKDDEGYYHRSLVYKEMNRWEDAFRDCNKALELNPKHDNAYNMKGVLYLEKGLYDLALENITKALSLANDEIVFYFNRAETYYRMQKWKEALLDYQQCQTLDPNYDANLIRKRMNDMQNKLSQTGQKS